MYYDPLTEQSAREEDRQSRPHRETFPGANDVWPPERFIRAARIAARYALDYEQEQRWWDALIAWSIAGDLAVQSTQPELAVPYRKRAEELRAGIHANA